MDLLTHLGSTATALPSDPVSIAAGLATALAMNLVIGATYQRTHTGALYTQSFVQTLVLVGMVASVVLRIVGENLAAAFAIFGAFSIIRFRNAVPETRDVGFIFFAMVVGLASGAGLYTLNVVTTVSVCATLLVMWRLNLFAPQRPSHTLRLRLTNDVDFGSVLEPAFREYLERATLLRIESVQGGLFTEVRYAVRLKGGVHPRALVSHLQEIAGNNRVVLIASGPEFGV
ncbi:MAG: DUF4956 domain-containing protein [Anaerolineae bacterium]